MKILDLKQHSKEWHDARRKHYCASDAAAMLGLSKYTTRTALLDRVAFGLEEEPSKTKQRLFARGHEAEALARPFAEEIIGEGLYPVVAVADIDGLPLLASLDGITMGGNLVWEHKLWNADLAQAVMACRIPDTHWPQLEHQMLVSGADEVLFMVSKGEWHE